jgi:hypothetical protein
MTLTLAFSSTLSTLATGGAVFGAFGLAFIGGWVEQIGALLGNDATTQVGIVVSLLVPTESLWQKAAHTMQPAFLRDLAFTPFTPASVPSDAMVFWSLGYIAVLVAFAVRSFGTRDL